MFGTFFSGHPVYARQIAEVWLRVDIVLVVVAGAANIYDRLNP